MNHAAVTGATSRQRKPRKTNSSFTFSPPEFFPLPSRGGDPFFGLSRSTYYDLERRGLLKLYRLRKPGHIRGKVLISSSDIRHLIHRMQRKGGGRHE